MTIRKLQRYNRFCKRCEKLFTTKVQHGNNICINCYTGNQDLLKHYPEDIVLEFKELNKNEFIERDNKVFKLKILNITDEEVIK